jgi:hypothetical protein
MIEHHGEVLDPYVDWFVDRSVATVAGSEQVTQNSHSSLNSHVHFSILFWGIRMGSMDLLDQVLR